jgi:hypothetical protein
LEFLTYQNTLKMLTTMIRSQIKTNPQSIAVLEIWNFENLTYAALVVSVPLAHPVSVIRSFWNLDGKHMSPFKFRHVGPAPPTERLRT